MDMNREYDKIPYSGIDITIDIHKILPLLTDEVEAGT